MLAMVCAVVIGIFARSAEPGVLELAAPGAQDSYYNLLVQGFRSGHLYVNREAPPELAQLSNPYDPALNTRYLWDPQRLIYEMSYYHGKLYLYFGVTPALALFWPYEMLTGHYLGEKTAVVLFFSAGFLIGAGLLYAAWRRYFAEINFGAVIAGTLAFGLATGILETLSSCDIYEVARSCGFMFVMLALAGIWRALHEPKRQAWWLALASLAYGLAVGARPSLLFGAVMLLAPIIFAWRMAPVPDRGGRLVWAVGATFVPITLIGLGLMLYNFLRFGSPFEFGWHYQLTCYQNSSYQQFSAHYLWFNFRFYFLHPMAWGGHFPFLRAVPLSPEPRGFGGMASPFGGIMTDCPIAWLALAAPLAWRGRPAEKALALRWFIITAFLLFLACGLTMCLFLLASSLYQMDFVPALMLLVAMGILGLERAIQDLPLWKYAVRCSYGLLLVWSVAFNIFATVEAHAQEDYLTGNYRQNQMRTGEALELFEKAVALQPQSGTFHYALANALSRTGQIDKSIEQYQIALEINPNDAEANNNLGYTLIQQSRASEAIPYFEKAVEIKPSYQAYFNLAYADRRNGMAANALTNYQKALELQPEFVPAWKDMAWIRATWPEASARDGSEAVAFAEKANGLTGGADPQILRTLAAAYAETGKFSEAEATAKKARALAAAQSKTVLESELQTELGWYEAKVPCRSTNN